jgi:hypothetical protein
MLRGLLVSLVGVLSACGPAVECGSGEASAVSLATPGSASSNVDHRVCASGGRDGDGWVELLSFGLKVGTLTTLEVRAPRIEETGTGTCAKEVSAVLYDDPANRNDFISPNFVSDWRDSPPTSCALTAVRAGERLEGTFSGHLRRLKNDGVTAEYAEVGFTFSVVAPKP